MELACGLAEEVVRTFGEVRLRVLGTSMVPSILPGDIVSIRRATVDEISTGEVILFSRERRFFVHRVVGRKVEAPAGVSEQTFLITRGDLLLDDDPPVPSTAVLGRVVSLERAARKIEVPAPAHYLMGRLFRASARATYLYLRILRFWRVLFLRRAKCQA